VRSHSHPSFPRTVTEADGGESDDGSPAGMAAAAAKRVHEVLVAVGSSVPVAVLVVGATRDTAAIAGEQVASSVTAALRSLDEGSGGGGGGGGGDPFDVKVFTLVDGDLTVVFTSGEEILETALCWLVARCPLVRDTWHGTLQGALSHVNDAVSHRVCLAPPGPLSTTHHSHRIASPRSLSLSANDVTQSCVKMCACVYSLVTCDL
jgi:hypothetical protein